MTKEEYAFYQANKFDFNCTHCTLFISNKCFYDDEYCSRNADDCPNFGITAEAAQLENIHIINMLNEKIKELGDIFKVNNQLLEQMGQKNFGGNWGDGEIIHSYRKAENGEFHTAAFIRYDIYLAEQDKFKALLKRCLSVIDRYIFDCKLRGGFTLTGTTELKKDIEEEIKEPWEKPADTPSKQKLMDAVKKIMKRTDLK